MPVRLDSRDPDFARQFETLLGSKREVSEEVGATVAAILADVRTRGDAAVIEYTEKFDRLPVTSKTLRITDAEIDEGVRRLEVACREMSTAHLQRGAAE